MKRLRAVGDDGFYFAGEKGAVQHRRNTRSSEAVLCGSFEGGPVLVQMSRLEFGQNSLNLFQNQI